MKIIVAEWIENVFIFMKNSCCLIKTEKNATKLKKKQEKFCRF